MTVNTCKEQINAMLPELTSTERKVAECVLECFEDIININVAELARKAEVSDATIVRFCRSVGYKGFTDFKLHVAREVVPTKDRFYPSIQKEDGSEKICNKIFHANMSALNRTMLSLDMQMMEAVANQIYLAENIVFFGTGGSNMVAQDAQHKFMKIGIKAMAYADVDMQLMASSTMGKRDVAIAISFSGNNRHVVECIENAKKRGAFTIGIISADETPLEKRVDAMIKTAKDETIFSSESTSTRIAQLSIIDALVGMVAFKDYKYFSDNISLTRSATTQSKY